MDYLNMAAFRMQPLTGLWGAVETPTGYRYGSPNGLYVSRLFFSTENPNFPIISPNV